MAMKAAEAEEKFRRGIEEFNARKFFEAHETWEEIWLASVEPEKAFLQGLIQIAAALHHWSRGNHAGAQSLLAAGLKKLEQFPAAHRSIDLAALRTAASRFAASLAANENPDSSELPQI